MSLHHLASLLGKDPDIQQAMSVLDTGKDLEIRDAPQQLRGPLLATASARSDQPILVISHRQDRSEELAQTTREFARDTLILSVWPGPEALPYDQMPIDFEASATRQAQMASLASAKSPPAITFASAASLGQLVSTPSDVREYQRQLSVGENCSLEGLIRWCLRSGYEVVPLVHRSGQIAKRGGIIDIFPPGSRHPYRIDFFGDEIDSIKLFDAGSQRSMETVSSILLMPTIDLPVWNLPDSAAEMSQLDTSALRPEVAGLWERTLSRANAGILPDSIDLFAPYLLSAPTSLLDHLPKETLVVLDDASAVELALTQRFAHATEARSTAERSGELPPNLKAPMLDLPLISSKLQRFQRMYLVSSGRWKPAASVEMTHFVNPPTFSGRLQSLTETVKRRTADGWSVAIATDQHDRVVAILESEGIYPRRSTRRSSGVDDLPPGTVDVVSSDIDGGWTNDLLKTMVLTDLEVFGFRKRIRHGAGNTRASPGIDLKSLNPGDFVVHVDHGIARFSGLTRITLTEVEREYLELHFDKGEKLFVPVDQSHRVVAYSSSAVDPSLSRLGSGEWVRTKRRVRRAVREMAFELVNLYATREAVGGYSFPTSTSWDIELAESFPYSETADQINAIQDVETGMEKSLPMDRLICGDVGFGKTEVAIRAAFKAVNAGKQVAVLVPTTVLALQHLSTFKQRLAAFPVNVEMLSRLRSPSEQRKTLQHLKEGAVDIVIGTHRLVQKDVQFRDLGLVIIDEEQRFGVRQKEFLKQLRKEVDVITMSATPIPRTLHASLVGIRDISTIDTAPLDRLPVRTFVTESSDDLLREVILREIDRGGQVFFVHNRVSSIERVAAKLEDLVPEARFGIGHGQMDEDVLEHIMVDFIDQKFDVLVCTTIIESGVDIPNANTIIIDNADTFGLTQLYQLRGRVGRGINRAYAYLLHRPGKVLSQDAQSRLDAIREATELGSGLKLAIRDMEIRGAGNILGAEQSGHIADVGYELYVRLLSQAVEELRQGEPIEEQRAILLDLPLTALIPSDYIEDVELRLATYRHIAEVRSERELRQVRAELDDRFGDIPEEVERLLALIRLRIDCERLGIESVVEREREIVIRPVETSNLDPRAVEHRFGRAVRLTPHMVRLRLPLLDEPWSTALQWIVDQIDESMVEPAEKSTIEERELVGISD